MASEKKTSGGKKVRVRHNGPKVRTVAFPSMGTKERAPIRRGDGALHDGGIEMTHIRFGGRLSKSTPFPVQEILVSALVDLKRAIEAGEFTVLSSR